MPQIDLQAGTVSTIAGTGEPGLQNGDATTVAQLRHPQKLALDRRGQRLFISDLSNTIRVLDLGASAAVAVAAAAAAAAAVVVVV